MTKKKFWLIVFPLLLIVGIGCFFMLANYSKGARSGVVIKVSEKGVLFKTKEGQMNLQSFGAVKSANNFAETFDFSIEKQNEHVYQELMEVSLTGERVSIYYYEKYIKLPWMGETKFFVDSIVRSGKVLDKNIDNRFTK